MAAALMPAISSADVAAPATLPAPVPFTTAQSEAIGQIAMEYLVAHPEVLVTASRKLREQQQLQQQGKMHALAKQAVAKKSALLQALDTPVINPDGVVSLVVFADYQCIYCARSTPMLDTLIKAHPEMRVVFREWPIFSSRWPASLTAARTGLAVWHQAGAQAYYRYHTALFATGHNEGKLTQTDIDDVLAQQHLTLKAVDKARIDAELTATQELAQELGLTGTPAFFVMPTTGATMDTTTALPGLPDTDTLEAALVKAGLSATSTVSPASSQSSSSVKSSTHETTGP